jgi:hypothetical protein
LPHRIGAGRSRLGTGALLLAASAVLAFGPPGPADTAGLAGLAVSAAVLGGGIVLGRRPGSRVAFRAVLIVAVIDVGLLLAGGRAFS